MTNSMGLVGSHAAAEFKERKKRCVTIERKTWKVSFILDPPSPFWEADYHLCPYNANGLCQSFAKQMGFCLINGGATFVVRKEGSNCQRGFEQALPCEAATRPASGEVSIGRISETERRVEWEKNLRVLFGARLNFSFSDASRP